MCERANQSDNTAMYFTVQNKEMTENLFPATATMIPCMFPPFIFQKGLKSYPNKASLYLQAKRHYEGFIKTQVSVFFLQYLKFQMVFKRQTQPVSNNLKHSHAEQAFIIDTN